MPQKVEALRVCSCITGRPDLIAQTEARLIEAFGNIILRGSPIPFDPSSYYAEEMGSGLRRGWYAFEALFGPEHLADSRSTTGVIEELLAREGKRRVNLDPGYLDHGKLVLASRKQAPDKLYLGDGVWAHACLRYRFGGFVAPDHSFPDFKSGCYEDFFLEARKLYKKLLKRHC